MDVGRWARYVADLNEPPNSTIRCSNAILRKSEVNYCANMIVSVLLWLFSDPSSTGKDMPQAPVFPPFPFPPQHPRNRFLHPQLTAIVKVEYALGANGTNTAELLAWEQAFLDMAAAAELTTCQVFRSAHAS